MTLLEEASIIQQYLEINCYENPVEIQERIRALAVYQARSGEMLAEAKKILNHKKTAEIQQTIISIAKEAHLAAGVQNALLKSICIEESFLVDWLDRINASCTHQSASMITLLSYAKEEMKLSGSQH